MPFAQRLRKALLGQKAKTREPTSRSPLDINNQQHSLDNLRDELATSLRPSPPCVNKSTPTLAKTSNYRCERCRGITVLHREVESTGHSRHKPYFHQSSFKALIASAAQGCSLCQLFSDRLQSAVFIRDVITRDEAGDVRVIICTDEQMEWKHGYVETNEYDDTASLTVKLITSSSERYQVLGEVKFGLFMQSPPQSDFGVVGRPIAPDPRAPDAVQLMKNWLEDCVSNHQECRITNPAFFPTRVIDVGPEDGSKDPVLVVNRGEMKSRYVALSHCWGSGPCITTSTSNLTSRQQSIPLSALPANFCDAIWVTRRLRLRFLWIDSLCILQDSKADWEIEVEQMGEVYANAYLTIAATSASDSMAGFLKPRRHGVASSIIDLQCKLPDGHTTGFMSLREYPATWKQGISEGILSRRGWTLQERVLAPRILHFVADQLYWECNKRSLAEGGLASSQQNPLTFSKALMMDFWNEIEQGSLADDLQRWYSIVEEYSKRALTISSDKLPAISGMAKAIGNRSPRLGVYCAGLWGGDFIRGLLWRSISIHGLHQPTQYRAPSWSWAGLDGPITYDWDNIRYVNSGTFARIADLDLGVPTSNPYGEIGGGWLRLVARMCPAVYIGQPPSSGLSIIGPGGVLVQDGKAPDMQWYDLWHFEPDSFRPIGPSPCRAYFDVAPEQNKLKHFALMRLGDFSGFEKPSNWWEEASWGQTWALILDIAGSENGKNVYKRAGVAIMNDKKSLLKWDFLSAKIV